MIDYTFYTNTVVLESLTIKEMIFFTLASQSPILRDFKQEEEFSYWYFDSKFGCTEDKYKNWEEYKKMKRLLKVANPVSKSRNKTSQVGI